MYRISFSYIYKSFHFKTLQDLFKKMKRENVLLNFTIILYRKYTHFSPVSF